MVNTRYLRYGLIGLIGYLFLTTAQPIFSWGFFAHKLINEKAVDTLPDEIRPFFEKHRAYLKEHAIDPDLWRNNDPDESVRHYIDIDMYESYPFANVPHRYEDATKKYGEETVVKQGTAPWRIEEVMQNLTDAFKTNDTDSILKWASALGHYISDLHVPLHTVENYDGQLTGNKGIHSRFERYMIEKHQDKLSLKPEKALYIEDTLENTFRVILDSYVWVDNILRADVISKTGLEGAALYTVEERNDRKNYIYSNTYYKRLYNELGELAQRQMQDSIKAVGSYWLTAWINAGKPKLSTKD